MVAQVQAGSEGQQAAQAVALPKTMELALAAGGLAALAALAAQAV